MSGAYILGPVVGFVPLAVDACGLHAWLLSVIMELRFAFRACILITIAICILSSLPLLQ